MDGAGAAWRANLRLRMASVDPSQTSASPRIAGLMLGLGMALVCSSLWLWTQEARNPDAMWQVISSRLSSRDRTLPVSRLWWMFSDLGHGYTLSILIGTLTVWLGSRRFLQDALVLTVSASLATRLLKVLVNRERPFDPDPFSWPSGHATASLALALALQPQRGAFVLALPLALLAGIARVMHHRHWPSDVLGGYGVALVCAAATLRLPTFLPAAVVAVPMREALAAGMFLFVLADLALAHVDPANPGYLPVLAAPLALLAAALGLALSRDPR
jgi:membrane-associated phospholipid phosphatase